MQAISFGISDVRRWAEFSGDFNPIHFDRESARGAGLADLVVHGMLALLPIKRELALRFAAGGAAPAPWMRFNALFRSPVPHDATSRIVTRPGRRGGLDFRLLAQAPEVERLRGSFGPCDDPFQGISLHAAAGGDLRRLSDADAGRFAASYPEVAEGWLALDAIVFSDFMRHRLGQVERAARSHLATLLRTSAAAECLFVQASHSVVLDTRALGSPGPLALRCAEMDCAMTRPEVIANADKVIGSVALPVLHAGRPVMLVEIGLLARPRFSTP